ncbi:MAG: hypothetical protein FWC28_05130 [Proteobacteria bacterium]|nr:hypothetical protein [Cystobacterineae bacterium]MCL2259025.1 hypothetical protein [Cystobacterineae bacterium]MCL2314621.1 hypothetical protein [Pseudomonadota bacterium]
MLLGRRLFPSEAIGFVEVALAMGTRSGLGIFHMVVALWGVGCALWKNPEIEVLSQLKACEGRASGEEWRIGGGAFRVQRMFFQRLTVVVEEGGKRAHIVGTLDLDGVWSVLHAKKEQYIRSLGFERVEFVYEGGMWKATQGCFPRLEAVLWFLGEQEEVEGVPGALGWNIRVERGGARISQEFEREGEGGRTGRRSFFLKREADGKLQKEERLIYE